MKARSSLFGFAALLLSLAGSACYNPTIENGTLQCSLSLECPDGYMCNAAGTCDKVGSPGAGGADGGGGGGGADAGPPMCFAQTFQAQRCEAKVERGVCDPVCQSGCGCFERCTVSENTTVCGASGVALSRNLYESCDPNDDRCQPGAICLREVRAECGAHCYRYCRTDSECGARSKCTGEIQIDNSNVPQKICSPQLQDCQPWAGGNRCNGRQNFGCYILSGLQPDLAICECAGTTREGLSCTFEHECQPGLECLPVNGVKACRRLCQMGTSCPGGGMCSAIALQGGVRSEKVGFCR